MIPPIGFTDDQKSTASLLSKRFDPEELVEELAQRFSIVTKKYRCGFISGKTVILENLMGKVAFALENLPQEKRQEFLTDLLALVEDLPSTHLLQARVLLNLIKIGGETTGRAAWVIHYWSRLLRVGVFVILRHSGQQQY